MKIRRKFLLFFVIFTISVMSVIGTLSLYFLKQEMTLFANAPNKAFLAIMSDKLYFKTVVGFVGLLIIFTVVSLFIGMLLFRLISNSYADAIQRITGLAENRVRVNPKTPEDEVLKQYINLLIEDQKKIRDLEKISAWKEGARLLIHEIKNPLTPLKLSVESLMLLENPEIESDIQSAVISKSASVCMTCRKGPVRLWD